MTLTFHTEFAFRILIYLQLYPDRIIPTREIAEKYGISINHLNKVSQKLSGLGYVSSTRGKGGGIQFKHSTMEIRLGDLIRKIEPPVEIAQCMGGGGLDICAISSVCGLRSIFAEAQKAFWHHLNQYTVANLNEKNAVQLKEIFETR